MKVYRDHLSIQEPDKGGVIAIGNFDGVHRGHQILLNKAKEKALELGVKAGVLTFSPHPREIFKSEAKPFRLTSDHQKQYLLEHLCQMDVLAMLNFDTEFAGWSAEKFIDDILIKGLGARHIIVGHDFCFGKKRSGNTDMLKQQSAFSTTVVDVLSDDKGTVFSSSEIRNALRRGDMDKANSLLGWEWFLEGEIIHGDKRGRELGYPTANMRLGNFLCPATGIYAVRVKIEGENEWRLGAANIGIRPMFRAEEPLCETFIFDFDGDLYGKTLQVKPVEFLRGEAKFDSLETLIAQMDKDCAQARKILQG